MYIETSKGFIRAGFTVAPEADAADVSIALRRRGWAPYRVRLEVEQNAWFATVIDWNQMRQRFVGDGV